MENTQNPRQLWHVWIDGRISPRFEIEIREAGAQVPAFGPLVAKDWEALEDLIRALDPHWRAEPVIGKDEVLRWKEVPRDPGTTADDFVKWVRIAIESVQPVSRLILSNRSFDQIEETLTAWRARRPTGPGT